MQTAKQSIPQLTEKDKLRFVSKVNKNGPLPDQNNPHYAGLECCWQWMAGKFPRGYGQFHIASYPYGAHRIAFRIAKGEIGDGLSIMHICDNPSCCNPSHLKTGTPAENNRDSANKGRTASGDKNASRLRPERVARGDRHGARLHPETVRRGESHGKAKMTEEKVREIRNKHAAGGISKRALAREFRLTKGAIQFIIIRKNWAHVK